MTARKPRTVRDLEAQGFVYVPAIDAWVHSDGREARVEQGRARHHVIVLEPRTMLEQRCQEAQNGYDDHAAACRRLDARLREIEEAARAYFDQHDWVGRHPSDAADRERTRLYAELRRVVETRR